MRSRINGSVTIELYAKESLSRVEFTVKKGGNVLFNHNYELTGFALNDEFSVKNPLLWSLSSPELYDYSAVISYCGGETEVKEGKFAFRDISKNEKNILLNGKPVFIRGFIRGAKAHDHANLLGLSLKDFYLKNLKEAKKFGFNFVRFHSVVPEEELFEAADEVGMLVHIELRPPHDIYNNLEEMVTTGKAIVPEEFIEGTVDKCFNHPSLCVYCIGNEIKRASESDIRAVKEKIDELDGTRLFLDTCAWGKNNRDGVDMDVQHLSYYFPYGAHAGMYDDTDNLLVVSSDDTTPLITNGENSQIARSLYFKVPLIAHEVCHYTALRDFYALKSKFQKCGAPMPWWVDEEIKMIEAKGYKNIFPQMYKASKKFRFECWKTAYEEMRSSKLLGGFHFLQFADTDAYENSNGVVDCFDDEDGVLPSDFLRFNGDRVLIAKLGMRCFFAGDNIIVPVIFSNLGEDDVKAADFAFELVHGEKTVANGAMNNIDVSRKGTYQICKINVAIPAEVHNAQLKLIAKLTVGGKIYSENEWTIWAFEKTAKTSYTEFVNTDTGKTLITDDIERAFNGLEQGKNVCLIYRAALTRHRLTMTDERPKYAFKASWNRFKPVIWDRGTNFGGLCDYKTLNKHGFACEQYYDFNFGIISEDCDKVILDDFPVKPDVIVRGIDKSSRDRFDAYKDCYNLPELMYDRTLRDYGYMFSLKVGGGKLLVCGLNLCGLDNNEPSSVGMANFIKKYISSDDFSPKSKLSLAELKLYMSECAKAPVKERTMTQFWALDDAPVESPEFWRTAKEYLK